jgi:hypothetical protein
VIHVDPPSFVVTPNTPTSAKTLSSTASVFAHIHRGISSALCGGTNPSKYARSALARPYGLVVPDVSRLAIYRDHPQLIDASERPSAHRLLPHPRAHHTQARAPRVLVKLGTNSFVCDSKNKEKKNKGEKTKKKKEKCASGLRRSTGPRS